MDSLITPGTQGHYKITDISGLFSRDTQGIIRSRDYIQEDQVA